MKHLRVLFSGMDHRERRRDTIRHPPPGILFSSLQSLAEMRQDYLLSFSPGERGITGSRRWLSRVWTTNNRIPSSALRGVDLVYSPGHILFSRTPYVVEIDNVSVLAYYKLGLLRACKPLLRRALKNPRCRAIVCISEAAKRSVQRFFEDEHITSKCVVVYPYAGKPTLPKRHGEAVRFLYVATNFYLKGGKEVVNAFERLAARTHNCELVLVTKRNLIDPALRARIERNRRITLVEADKTKQQLLKQCYSTADVFVQPTYQDSFGMVFLEALSAGLPIITTRMFATPEMVQHGVNGYLLKSPISYFTAADLPNPTWWEVDKAQYAKTHVFSAVERTLEKYMHALATNKALRARYSAASRRLFAQRFSEKKRLEALSQALRGSL